MLLGGLDAAVIVLGGANNLADNGSTEGEGKDRASLTLPGHQLSLLEGAWSRAEANKVPLVVVLVDGKPTAEKILLSLPSTIVAFQAGQAQGRGIAEVILGITNPSGKLPVSFPLSADILPVYYNYFPSSTRGGWCDAQNGVIWPFGHGLSFTEFSYASLRVPTNVSKSGTLRICVDVENKGTVAGTEVVQLYIRDVIASVNTPIKMLKGFQRVSLKPKEIQTVCMEVDVATELRLIDRTYNWIVEDGYFNVLIGSSSDDIRLTGQFYVGP